MQFQDAGWFSISYCFGTLNREEYNFPELFGVDNGQFKVERSVLIYLVIHYTYHGTGGLTHPAQYCFLSLIKKRIILVSVLVVLTGWQQCQGVSCVPHVTLHLVLVLTIFFVLYECLCSCFDSVQLRSKGKKLPQSRKG